MINELRHHFERLSLKVQSVWVHHPRRGCVKREMTNEMSTRTHSSDAVTATGATQNMRNGNLDARTFATSMAL